MYFSQPQVGPEKSFKWALAQTRGSRCPQPSTGTAWSSSYVKNTLRLRCEQTGTDFTVEVGQEKSGHVWITVPHADVKVVGPGCVTIARTTPPCQQSGSAHPPVGRRSCGGQVQEHPPRAWILFLVQPWRKEVPRRQVCRPMWYLFMGPLLVRDEPRPVTGR